MDPEAAGPIYSAEQIRIPPELPEMLKEYTKAAIRTQPSDLLQWSAAYFQALSRNEVPPVKDRLEQPLPTLDQRLGGLTKGTLSILHKQLGGANKTVSQSVLSEKWRDAGITQSKLDELIAIGGFEGDIEWEKMLTVACTALEKTLPDALRVLCEIISPDSEGGPARIPLEQFRTLFTFLAHVDGEISPQTISSVMEWLETESGRYSGTVGPREFLHPSCPRFSPH